MDFLNKPLSIEEAVRFLSSRSQRRSYVIRTLRLWEELYGKKYAELVRSGVNKTRSMNRKQK